MPDPAPVTVQVHVNAGLAFAPPAMFCGTPAAAVQVPVPVPRALTDVATAVTLAVAPPVFVAVRVMFNTWPTLTETGFPWMVSAACTAAGDWMVTLAFAVGEVTVADELASFPLALALSESVPVVPDEQLPYTKGTVAPPATVAAAGVVPQDEIAVGVTEFTAAVPVFVTESVTVKVWFWSAVGRLGVSVAVNAPGVWTVTEAVAVPVETDDEVFASVPVADPLRESVPALAAEQFE
ncbi:MAG TPA: hypothetical protein VMT17_11165 [Anaeromyxobacteraceae bacterium]|nr:hypothetical protein [Anaeromyxobacteraceae bacterium]